MRQDRRPPVEVICHQCGVAFIRKASELNKGARRAFCSRACVTASQRTGMVEATCQQCGVSFTRRRSDFRAGGGVFCSRTCVSASQRRGEVSTRTCQRCSQTFEIQPHRVTHGRGSYCSTACRKKPLPAVMAQQSPQSKPSKPAKPTSITPKADDRIVLDGWADTGSVLCARCRQPRPRGSLCVRCEWRAFQGVSA